jgi:hypothetical protein
VERPVAVKWIYRGYAIERTTDDYRIYDPSDNNVWAGIWGETTFLKAQKLIDKLIKKEVR